MPKLHELLAVEGQLKSQAQVTRTELHASFMNKRHLFEKKIKTFRPIEEGAPAVTEEQLEIQTTVAKELGWIAALWSKALDASYQVAEANTRARADVVLDDKTVLLANMPTTALMDLDHRAGEILELIKAIPTLDPAKGFTADPSTGDGVFKAREVTKPRTRKVQKPLVLLAPTKEHPGQAQLISEDVAIGTITENEWSGMLTTAAKADMLDRIEEVRRALRQARMRANDAAVASDAQVVGKKVFDYVFGLSKATK